MTTYFSDREFGPKPMVEETIDRVVWQAILSLIETRSMTDPCLWFPVTLPGRERNRRHRPTRHVEHPSRRD